MSATEDKTIIEELLEEAPAALERRKKLAAAKHCVSQGEWDEADALYDEILLLFPEDEIAVKGKLLLKRSKARAEAQQRKQNEKNAKKHKKQQEKEAKRKPRKPHKAVPLFHSKRFLVLCIAVFLLAGAAVAAVMGISAHRNSIAEMYGEDMTQDTCVVTVNRADVF